MFLTVYYNAFWKVLIIIPLQVLRGLELGEAGESRQIGVFIVQTGAEISSQLYQYSGNFQAFQASSKLSLLEILCVWHCSHNVPNVIRYRRLMLHLLIDWEKIVWYFNHNVRSLVAFILHSMWQDKLNKLVAKPKCKWRFQYFIQD